MNDLTEDTADFFINPLFSLNQTIALSIGNLPLNLHTLGIFQRHPTGHLGAAFASPLSLSNQVSETALSQLDWMLLNFFS